MIKDIHHSNHEIKATPSGNIQNVNLHKTICCCHFFDLYQTSARRGLRMFYPKLTKIKCSNVKIHTFVGKFSYISATEIHNEYRIQEMHTKYRPNTECQRCVYAFLMHVFRATFFI